MKMKELIICSEVFIRPRLEDKGSRFSIKFPTMAFKFQVSGLQSLKSSSGQHAGVFEKVEIGELKVRLTICNSQV